jgi:hypothetical protein
MNIRDHDEYVAYSLLTEKQLVACRFLRICGYREINSLAWHILSVFVHLVSMVGQTCQRMYRADALNV